MKKIASILLALVIAVSMCATVAFAATTSATLTVNSSAKTANAGDIITVTVDLSANSDLGVLTFNLLYNTDEYEYVADSLKVNGIFSMEETNDRVAGRLRYVAITATTVNKGGACITAQFKVLKPGSTISLDVEEAYNGSDEDVTTSLAGRVTNLTVACAHGKTEEKVTKQPTHTETGTKAIICSACGKTMKTESIPALGHTYGAWTVTKAPTCTEKGVETRTCSCGDKQTRDVPAKGHTPGKWVTVNEPTCTQAGAEAQHCSVCDTEIARREIPAKGHTPGEWTVTKEPTCTEKGEKIAECVACGEKYTEEIPALGHTADKWEVVKEATCTEAGEKKAVCSVCDEEFTEAIPALGHKFGEWKVTKEATEAAEGEKTRVCEVCGEKETAVIPKLPVKPDDGKNPDIPNTTGNAMMYIVITVAAAAVLAGACGVTAITKKRKQAK